MAIVEIEFTLGRTLESESQRENMLTGKRMSPTRRGIKNFVNNFIKQKLTIQAVPCSHNIYIQCPLVNRYGSESHVRGAQRVRPC